MADGVLSILIQLKDEATEQLGKVKTALSGLDDQIGISNGNAIKFAGLMGAAGGAVIAFATVSVTSFISVSREIGNMSLALGMSVEKLSALKFIAESTGVSFSTLQSNFRIMAVLITNASQGQAEATKTLRELGLSYSQLRSLSPDETFMTLAAAISNIEDPIKRADMATKVFGRAGLELLPMFAMGADGMEAMTRRAYELGIIMSEDDVKAGRAMGMAMTEAKEMVEHLQESIAKALGPTLIEMAGWFVGVVKSIKDFIEAHPTLVKAIVIIAGAMVGAALAVAALVAGLTALAILSGVGIPVAIAAAAGATVVGGGLIAATVMAKNEIPSYQYGGIVPGPVGAPRLIFAHGGERFSGTGGEGVSGGNTVINNYIQGSIVTERDIADIMRRQLYLMKTRNTNLGLA